MPWTHDDETRAMLGDPVNGEPEPECECENITGRWDLEERFDSRNCPVHGPYGTATREERRRQAAEEWEFWSGGEEDGDCPF